MIVSPENEVIYNIYRRHQANINQVFAEELQTIVHLFPDMDLSLCITGSAGMGLSERMGIPFVQEVIASAETVRRLHPDTRVLIDLGGEDAKMVFFHPHQQPDIRMNGSCAGGTGAFIDQMADLMNLTVEELGHQALRHDAIYPVASRCGVFAKTDVQNLISRNIPTPNIAMSILHTVALQSITALAKGMDIRPPILCTGGPLTFLPALRNAFKTLLHVNDAERILPPHSEYFSAWGAAVLSPQHRADLPGLIRTLKTGNHAPKDCLPALFGGETAYRTWKQHRHITPIARQPLGTQQEINVFLGIDSGSTTTKILLIDPDARLVYTSYEKNEGNPLKKAVDGLHRFFAEAEEKNVKVHILSSAATGYGEDLIRSALGLRHGLVETMAHLAGAQYVDPQVSFVLDIGGQDMKAIFIREGVISHIEINEACSSGCGSFLQNFASTMHLPMDAFIREACLAEAPADLGSRCTVFMNSKVKQSLRENVGMGNISAGLAYSVIKNCLYKTLKMSNLRQLGEHIVVQGGTFRNDAVCRALELLSGKQVRSTNYPELMGAFGAALYARSRWKEEEGGDIHYFSGKESLPDTNAIETKELHCKGCPNQCATLRFTFANGNNYYAGNKCEKVFSNRGASYQKGFNAFRLKNELLFDRGDPTSAPRPGLPAIGIPRVLNMYENYPFWRTLFTACGFRVVLSPESHDPLYRKGVGSVMSDNICFPAKLVHGHIIALAEMGVDRIFYPIIPMEEQEFNGASNSYNCPIVSGYPDVIRSAVEPWTKYGIPLDKPVITFAHIAALKKACYRYLSAWGISGETFGKAFDQALSARKQFVDTLRNEQQKRLHEVIRKGEWAFVVAGRPYHADPLIHQKTGQILSDLGIHVFTDDVFRRPESEGFQKLKIVSQWAYPNRVVQAAMEVAQLPRKVQLVQLNSFGCGPDSFFMDETGDILKQAGKSHTVLRIDEIAASGSIRLRVRSLVASLKLPEEKKSHTPVPYAGYEAAYTEKDRQKTILIPWFADFISPFIPAVAELAGYKMENLPRSSVASADAGLKYGNNEVCYPSILILGDMIQALQSGKYDTEQIVVAITQTGGQCRATNYLSQIKTGLQNAGFAHIPVVVISAGEVFGNEQKAFRIPYLKFLHILLYALLYADALQQMYSAGIIREKKKGETAALFHFYINQGVEAVRGKDAKRLLKLLEEAVADFNQIAMYERAYTKIGLVGEIFVKYNNHAQAHISEWLRAKGMEVSTPPILDFLMQYFVNSEVNIRNHLSENRLFRRILNPVFLRYINKRIRVTEQILQNWRFYEPAESIFAKAQYASEVIDLSHQFGEGWAIAAEVAVYARRGINRVVCVQPFGCIANHVVAKGIEKRLKSLYPGMSLLYLDIDGGASEVNLQNRLHFMM
jgi:predicted CoA-substrate-specific enzyme activase